MSWAGAQDGVLDAALKLSASPIERLTASADAHLFLASAPRGGDAVLGQEIDLWAAIAPSAGLRVLVGGAGLARPGLDPDGWAFLQLDARL